MDIKKIIEENLNAFQKFNNLKYERFQSLVTNSSVKKVINAIPALLSANDRKLPGFVEGGPPCGVFGFSPDQDVVRYLKSRFSVDFSRCSGGDFVQMFAVMGSVGTIGYNKKSDFDYWACIDRQKVDDRKYQLFCKKVEEIQKWAIKESGVEVHIFINDINSLRENVFAEDEDEGFGSTVGAVLKDEFFRSSIIIAGKIPFWWVVPKFADDKAYVSFINSIDSDFFDSHFIDIGNLHRISKEDFLGAALFQLIKAIGNPFKSILKIGILEKYLFSDENVLLSHKIKSSVQKGELDILTLDSYLLMFNEVYKYYESVLQDKSLLKILRQNLYLKIDPQLTKYTGIKDRKNLPYKVTVMFSLVNEWGWGIDEIGDLDDFESWDYNRIIQFWNNIKKFMLLSYQKISKELPTLNLRSKISESDFKLLSSKIKANFSTEPDKIENFITFKDTPNEPYLYIEPDSKAVRDYGWKLYKKVRIEGRSEREISIKNETDLVKLLSWCSINQLYEPSFSRVFFEPGYNYINKNLVTELLNHIFEMFNSGKVHLSNKFFLEPPRTLKNMIIMNFTENNPTTIASFYHLYMNTWGESFLKKYSSMSDLVMLYSKIIKDAIYFSKDFDEFCYFFSPEPHKKIYRNIEKIFRSSYDFFIKSKEFYNQKLITSIDNTIICVTKENNDINVASFGTVFEMLGYISQRPCRYPEFRILFEDSQNLAVLDEIYSRRTVNGINITYEEKQKYSVFYITDENGNLFTFIKKKSDVDIMSYMYRFCLNTVKRVKGTSTGRSFFDEVTSFKLEVDRFGKFSIKNETRRAKEIDVINSSFPMGIIAEVIYKDSYPFYILRAGGKQTKPSSLSKIVENYKTLGMQNPPEIIDIKFHNLSPDKLESGSMVYFLEKFRLEKTLGSSF
ncbi:MAG TPA: class I adenylate cyclase [Spirochaetota bacterium]|nr:class I adenylate cyclase [Spirochaetota bacterium]HOK93391.1 class I adenylate cyclase [Spirochaetota bacterium]HPP95999.1 class I adenylate cyclase [Spirochaetota bacterium]